MVEYTFAHRVQTRSLIFFSLSFSFLFLIASLACWRCDGMDTTGWFLRNLDTGRTSFASVGPLRSHDGVYTGGTQRTARAVVQQRRNDCGDGRPWLSCQVRQGHSDHRLIGSDGCRRSHCVSRRYQESQRCQRSEC